MKRTQESEKLLRVAVYIRVSSDEQAERGDSIRDQKERGLHYIEEHHNMILHDIYLDDGVSGQKIDRDDFTRLMNHVKEGFVDLIIFTKLDRWFRSLRHYLNTQAILEKHHAAWTAIDQPYFDTSTPYGRAFVAQSMTFAELEAQNDGLRVTDVFRTKVAHGEVITGKFPRGYQIQDKHLVLSEEAPAIYDTLMYFLKHQSMNKAVEYLKETYGIIMTLQNFKQSLLRNEKITGRYRDNDSYCPRLISDKDFCEIQRILDYNTNIKSSQKYPYIFTGLLICGECGRKMGGCQINTASKRKDGTVIRYKYPAYECKQHRAYKTCGNGGQIREVRIEECLLKKLREQLGSYTADFETKGRKTVDNRFKKNQLRRKISRLKDLYLNEAITLEEYKTDRAEFEAELEKIPDIEPPSEYPAASNCMANTDFESMYRHLDNQQKRLFWRSVIREIRLSGRTGQHREYTVIFL
ncbi:recombinase family protein [Lacrimispora amygdalina]|uniref:recombinase family protein n=1 Tax=Lacrimispora amygdalina TaxID=253257 RepID=UPI000BE4079B|nr:recombinase family protein [Lacrimispora amygdalina]